ncbi:class IV lanthionine synthetase LanL [Streptomyces sp. VNUA116]|uniref:class IV lanthionine synthetase LanL n=1 Tax=Streptomyces sp. VNUA116 TaxID=3062449 RepID=UPI002674A1E3|nr:class IV lanthionine synthetase LanL [Streptomyces sp. VNUA116]WKU43202.1 class IV lanthionine synthetase LanL [Streptomyces sp. VNUA116]
MTVSPQASYQSVALRILGAERSAWTLRDSETWCMVTPVGYRPRRQGWKLHLSATVGSAHQVLRGAAGVLVAHGCAFKFAVSPRVTADLTSVRAPREHSGKFLTAYPADDDQLRTLAEELHRATLGLPGPAILSDRRYRPDSLVHYRFGCFSPPRELDDEGFYRGRLQAPDGTLTADERNAWFSPPAWARPPFDPPVRARGRRDRGGPVLIAGRYLVREAVRHSNRGGVYRAQDEHTGEDVLLKEARAHVGAQPGGSDARDWLRYEAGVLARLAPQGMAPAPREVFEAGGHVFLAEDLIDGENLHRWSAEEASRNGGLLPVPAAWRLARELTRLVGDVHAAGFVLRDLKPTNVVMRPDGTPVLVDLECAVRTGTTVHVAGTQGFTAPEHLSGAGTGPAPGPEADCFSLGATLLHATAGINPLLAPDAPPARSAGDRLAVMVEAAAGDCPALAALAPLVLGLTADAPARWPLEKAAAFLRAGTGAETGTRTPVGAVTAAGAGTATEAGTSARGKARARVRARTRIGPPAAAESPGAPLPLLQGSALDRLLHDGLGLIAATADPEAVHLWPRPRSLPEGDPCNVQQGAAGVLAVLDRAVRTGEAPALLPLLRTAAHWIDAQLALPGRVLPGLYFGRSGTAWALHDAALTLDDPGLAGRARAYALRIPLEWPDPDVCHGLAGAGTAQLHLWHATGDPRFAERASQCADGVLRRTMEAEGGVDWLPGPPHRRELAGSASYGFAHGVAGLVAFLLAAGRDLDRPELVDIAIGGGHALCAVAERRGDIAVWPKGPGRTERQGLDFWCNGASGIGTALVRLWQATGDPLFREYAERAGRAAHRDRWRVGPGSCHGVAGNAQLLVDLADMTGDAAYRDQAAEAAYCLYARAAVLQDGRLAVPDDTLREFCVSYQVGLAGALDLLLRLKHGGGRPWMTDRTSRAERMSRADRTGPRTAGPRPGPGGGGGRGGTGPATAGTAGDR